MYGKEIYDEDIEKLNQSEFEDLCSNIRHGVPIATPVFDGAKENDVTKMLELAELPNSGQTLSKLDFLWCRPFCHVNLGNPITGKTHFLGKNADKYNFLQ